MKHNLVRERISGRVLAVEREKKDRNRVYIGSRKFGTMILKAVLPDEEVKDVLMNDEIQLSGQLRLRKRIANDGTTVRDVLVMKPVVEHIVRLNKVYKGV